MGKTTANERDCRIRTLSAKKQKQNAKNKYANVRPTNHPARTKTTPEHASDPKRHISKNTKNKQEYIKQTQSRKMNRYGKTSIHQKIPPAQHN